MSIIIKSGSTTIPGARVSGQFSYFLPGDNTPDLGPSSRTGFYQGLEYPQNGFAPYALGGPSGVTVRLAYNTQELNGVLIQYGATGKTLSENVLWSTNSGLSFIYTDTVLTFKILTQSGAVLSTQSGYNINYQ
jgi:hypothetical protein